MERDCLLKIDVETVTVIQGVLVFAQTLEVGGAGCLVYDLVIVGETLHKVSAEIKGAAPAMEWRGYSDLRNYIVHSYWQIDFEIIAEIVRNRLDPLIAELDALIAFVERSET